MCEEITRCADDIQVVGTAASAREAVRLYRELHPRVVLMDSKMESYIASQRFVQESTIRSHVNHILKKFNKRRMREVIQLLRENRFFDVI